MEIVIDGWRAGIEEWKRAQKVPVGELPSLSNEQRHVANQLSIREEDYARSVVAGRRTQDELLQKARSLALLLEQKLKSRNQTAAIDLVRLKAIDHRFDIEATAGGSKISLRIDEDLVDDLLQSGSEEVDRRLDRVVELALASRVA
jgi:hypothetical protein